MRNYIGIVMGGYLDENDKLMDRAELNRRIAVIQKENEILLEAVNYGNDMACYGEYGFDIFMEALEKIKGLE